MCLWIFSFSSYNGVFKFIVVTIFLLDKQFGRLFYSIWESIHFCHLLNFLGYHCFFHKADICCSGLCFTLLCISRGSLCGLCVVFHLLLPTAPFAKRRVRTVISYNFLGFVWDIIKGLSPVTKNVCCQSARGNRSGAIRYFPEAVRKYRRPRPIPVLLHEWATKDYTWCRVP